MNEEKTSEIDALKGIDKLLEHLTQEERLRVFNFINSKYSISILATKPAINSGSLIAAGNSENFDPETSAKQFLAAKKPQGFYEQIACLGYYIEKIQGISDGFDTASITSANTDARALKIPNTSLYLSDVVSKYGYFSSIGGGKKALTARGEALVEALPDREAVKLAHENHPMKKKSGGKKKSSKK
jgi:hypothetical protein